MPEKHMTEFSHSSMHL